jgi:hypothetical protein
MTLDASCIVNGALTFGGGTTTWLGRWAMGLEGSGWALVGSVLDFLGLKNYGRKPSQRAPGAAPCE